MAVLTFTVKFPVRAGLWLGWMARMGGYRRVETMIQEIVLRALNSTEGIDLSQPPPQSQEERHG